MTAQHRSRWPLALAFAASLVPAAATAQDPAPQAAPAGRTHVVRAGDTLWDLARTYLNDPFLWPEIYRLNTEVVEDPHWIYPGETLRLPGDAVAAPVVVAEGEEEPAPSRAGTVFASGARGSDQRRGGVTGRGDRPLIRRGDYYAAPWVGPEGGERGAGRVGERLDVTGVGMGQDRLQLHDVVSLTTPDGRVALNGERYLTYRLDEILGDRGQVLVPTGMVVVEQARGGHAQVARVIEAFGQVRAGDHVIAVDSFAVQPYRATEPVPAGVGAEVLWIEGDPMLPALHQYLVLSARERDDVRPGDRFALLRNAGSSVAADSPDVLAMAQVIRVTPRGVTVLLTGQAQPGVKVGSAARLSGRLP